MRAPAKITILTILLITSFNSFSQTLFEIFRLLPDHLVMDEGLENREVIIQRHFDGATNFDSKNDIYYYFDIVDHKNGYMTLDGAFEGSWSMCYWNLENGEKLVAVLLLGCGPLCGVENFEFFKYKNDLLSPVEIKEIKTLTETDFFSISVEKYDQMLEEFDIPIGFIYELPRYGKNITAKLYCEFDGKESDYSKFLKQYQIGDRLTLEFNKSGSFSRGKFYWAND